MRLMLTISVCPAVLTEDALKFIQPFPFAAVRVGLATPCLWAIARATEPGAVLLAPTTVAVTAFLGMTGVYVPQSLIFVGIQWAGPDITAIMQCLVPVLVALLSAMLGTEQLSLLKGSGIALAVSGAVVMLDPLHVSLASSQTDGIFVLVFQTFCYACFIITLARLLSSTPRPFTLFAWACTFATLALVATAAIYVPSTHWRAVPLRAWLTLGYCCLVVSVGAHGAISWAVRHVSATVPSLYTCLQPLCTSTLAAVVYGERLDVHEVVGMLLIVPGMVVTVWAKRREDLHKHERDESPPPRRSLSAAVEMQSGHTWQGKQRRTSFEAETMPLRAQEEGSVMHARRVSPLQGSSSRHKSGSGGTAVVRRSSGSRGSSASGAAPEQ
jgi:drug/metabolite transporter (DMT)-like permease